MSKRRLLGIPIALILGALALVTINKANAHYVLSGWKPVGTENFRFTHFGPTLRATLWVYGGAKQTVTRSDTDTHYWIGSTSMCINGSRVNYPSKSYYEVWGDNQFAVTPRCSRGYSLIYGIGGIDEDDSP